MKVETVITRAMSGLGKGTLYKSPGKMPSFDASEWPANAQNDCSGFVDWCLRFKPNRKVDHPLYKKINGGWFKTTAIHADGMASVGYFTQLESPKKGAILVYPDYVGTDGKSHDGHIGFILEVAGNDISGATKVIHCSLGGYNNHGDAIQITDSGIWRRHPSSIIVWYDDLED